MLNVVGIDAVHFIEHPNGSDMLQFKIGENAFDRINLGLILMVADIDNMQQEVSAFQLFKRGAKSDQQVFRQVLNKTDCISDNDLAVFGKF